MHRRPIHLSPYPQNKSALKTVCSYSPSKTGFICFANCNHRAKPIDDTGHPANCKSSFPNLNIITKHIQVSKKLHLNPTNMQDIAKLSKIKSSYTTKLKKDTVFINLYHKNYSFFSHPIIKDQDPCDWKNETEKIRK